MAKLYITFEVEAKDKLEAAAKAKSITKDRYDMNFIAVASENPYNE